MTPTPKEAVDKIEARFGSHPGRRRLHAKGVFCSGTFVATGAASALCRAAHLQGTEIPVRARVSNGGGDPGVPDYEPDVRGLAVKFDLPDGSSTDISSQSAPRFSLRSVDEFFELMKASANPLRVVGFAATRPGFARTLPLNGSALRPPPSFANVQFYAIHAYRWLAADGSSRWVRYEWVPEAGSERIGLRDARKRGRDYLFEEWDARLRTGPVRWSLSVQIAGESDDPHDPMKHWPEDRERIDAGTLTLTAVVEDPEAGGGAPVVFDPTRVTDGIELSDDPVLRFRPDAYSEAVDRRAG
jgi:catalase